MPARNPLHDQIVAMSARIGPALTARRLGISRSAAYGIWWRHCNPQPVKERTRRLYMKSPIDEADSSMAGLRRRNARFLALLHQHHPEHFGGLR